MFAIVMIVMAGCLASSCSRRWGFQLSKAVVQAHAAQACAQLHMHLVDIQESTVVRFMAGRVLQECKAGSMWVAGGQTFGQDDDGEQSERPALCWSKYIPTPGSASPAQSVLYTVTSKSTRMVTRPFDLHVTVSITALRPAPSAITRTDVITETAYTTAWTTYSVPAMVPYGQSTWQTVYERLVRVITESTGVFTTTLTSTITVTTTVIGVVSAERTVTERFSCSDKLLGFTPFIPTNKIIRSTATAGTSTVTKARICDRFSSLSELQICTDHSSPFVVVQAMVEYGDAECVCGALGLKFAQFGRADMIERVRGTLRHCMADAWMDRAWINIPNDVCNALGVNDQITVMQPCINQYKVICQ